MAIVVIVNTCRRQDGLDHQTSHSIRAPDLMPMCMVGSSEHTASTLLPFYQNIPSSSTLFPVHTRAARSQVCKHRLWTRTGFFLTNENTTINCDVHPSILNCISTKLSASFFYIFLIIFPSVFFCLLFFNGSEIVMSFMLCAGNLQNHFSRSLLREYWKF